MSIINHITHTENLSGTPSLSARTVATMDMGMADMGAMGSMSMGSGVPGLLYMQLIYWALVGGAIGFATTINMFCKIQYWQRLASSKLPSSRGSVS